MVIQPVFALRRQEAHNELNDRNGVAYTWDMNGNASTRSVRRLLSDGVKTYAGVYPEQRRRDSANRLVDVNGVAYTWDLNGNLLSDGVKSYVYDSANRLIEVDTGDGGGAEYTYNGLGDRLTETAPSPENSSLWETKNYTLDLNTGLTQVLSDGTTTYTYGLGRISQQSGTMPEYFLGDALGSVRQMTDQAGGITFARNYDPYGVVTYTGGTSQTEYGFTGEQYGDSTQLLYLRARYYSPADGRFQSRDTWGGDYNRPLSLNRWMYVEGNPVNLVDPSGYYAWEDCTERNNPICMEKVRKLQQRGVSIKGMVETGALRPVEGFAQYIDYAQVLFNSNMRGMAWALTLTIDGMDANQAPVWIQWTVWYPGNWLGPDWLPYKTNSDYNVENWLDNGTGTWIHSRRGDWRIEYWDKTANQAFHFWYYAAVTFFDGRGWAEFANSTHEQNREEIVFFPEWIPPPQSGSTEQDNNLSFAAFDFGEVLDRNDEIYRTYYDMLCASDTNLSLLFNHVAYIKPSAWIRANLKGHVH